jgi:hypothetical protein
VGEDQRASLPRGRGEEGISDSLIRNELARAGSPRTSIIACKVPEMIEVSKFRLLSDVSTDQFLEKNADYQQRFVYQQEGLVRRTVASGLEGEWVSITWWRSMNDARQSATGALTSSVALEFGSLLDTSSIATEHFKELSG